jgi:hypothetical protein
VTSPADRRAPSGSPPDGLSADARELLVGWRRSPGAPTLLAGAPMRAGDGGTNAPGAGAIMAAAATPTAPVEPARRPRHGRGAAAGLRSILSAADGAGRPGLGAAGGARLRAFGAVLLSLAVLLGIAPLAEPAARAASPRVAIIVGPVGSLTASYRADAEKAAAAARRYTDDVVTVYSPDATWAAAKAAMSGASVVVYLGHGNGFPSRYSRTLNRRVQNGLGLNPVAGRGNDTHQYFGEAALARQVMLAPDAVVVLSHLCYASGNSEPGLPEA